MASNNCDVGNGNEIWNTLVVDSNNNLGMVAGPVGMAPMTVGTFSRACARHSCTVGMVAGLVQDMHVLWRPIVVWMA